jgi:putative DNA primase/helicase
VLECRDYVHAAITTGEIKCVQQTFLTPSGEKLKEADGKTLRRFTYGSSPKGSAIELDPLGPLLFIGEGAETCLAARQLGMRPMWALGPAGGIPNFPVLDGVEVLVIIGENDNGASREAIAPCVARWQVLAGRNVKQCSPSHEFKDFNDQIMGVRK